VAKYEEMSARGVNGEPIPCPERVEKPRQAALAYKEIEHKRISLET
jgi:hypothetical protein